MLWGNSANSVWVSLHGSPETCSVHILILGEKCWHLMFLEDEPYFGGPLSFPLKLSLDFSLNKTFFKTLKEKKSVCQYCCCEGVRIFWFLISFIWGQNGGYEKTLFKCWYWGVFLFVCLFSHKLRLSWITKLKCVRERRDKIWRAGHEEWT